MVNITHKSSTLRKAIATAEVQVSLQQTIDTVQSRKVPKGDIFEFARAAGLLAIKKTSDVIPDCHPLPVEYAAITYEIVSLSIIISVEVHTIYKTGVEVEAMHGAAVAALVMYDMLKPIDKNVQINNVQLKEKKGGKSDLKQHTEQDLKCAVVVCSDSIAAGTGQDTAGKAIIAALAKYHLECSSYEVIPDNFDTIQSTVKAFAGEKYDLVIFTGGTGLSKKDITPDAITPLIETEIPGIMEAARSYGGQRIRTAMLSRGVAGFIGDTLVLTFPGSKNAAQEYMDAVFPQVLHVFEIRNGERHS